MNEGQLEAMEKLFPVGYVLLYMKPNGDAEYVSENVSGKPLLEAVDELIMSIIEDEKEKAGEE